MASNFKIVLYAPEIPGNTGSIGRTCVALNIELILIKPYGFDLSEKAVRRAGLDYWKYVKLTEYDSWDQFIASESPKREDLILIENNLEDELKGELENKKRTFFDANYSTKSFLVFGSETKGIDSKVLQLYRDRIFELPMYSEHIRSLNLSNAATAVAYECLRQLQK